ncbi:VOC family protein [Nitratireductor sp. CAU 1489]|uniref:VOC family protein n=1 Tax=Nitratireductor arenosus TaxID=2682096 RepID=A0A844QJH6_9HYPH|nr:VOC family protein [Nitratireductor arenosus]MVA97849.1 VOC family protein [Nitratireductor arenosus]
MSVAAYPLPLDHLVLPTADLATASDRLSALGFTVAPTGTHPFGTVNRCVYFADGCFLEPLAIGDRGRCAAAIAEGNVFVARDDAFRQARGEEGFSAIVFATPDAEAEHARYVSGGISPGKPLSFARPFVDADGQAGEASFRLAFATIAGFDEPFFFACQRIGVPAVDRSALEAHENGARRLAGAIVIADDTDPIRQAIATIAGAAAPPGAGPATLALPNAAIEVMRPDDYRRRFGANPDCGRSGFALIRVGVDDIEVTRALLTSRTIVNRIVGNGVLVPRAAGQGADILFEAGAAS